ncbi:tRNA-splicing endonuclease subunit Sen15 [Peziza echinospora]|nr:tRNA-splicing endonuclease subunit Sen15 [Peziza echinospora]
MPSTDGLAEVVSQHAHADHIIDLANIVLKNLQHQADWSETILHTSPAFPRPLISGVPPEAIYVDPDTAGKANETEKDDGTADADQKIDREWVLPVGLREKWTVRQWAEIFDSIPAEPPVSEAVDGANAVEVEERVQLDQLDGVPVLQSNTGKRKKRLVMAIVSGDSTVVYYIVHDGIVKPRQN